MTAPPPAGLPPREPPADPARRREVAFHEAGHAVAGHVLGLTLLGLDVERDREGGFGHTMFEPAPPRLTMQSHAVELELRRDFVERVVTTFLAGVIAQRRVARGRLETWAEAGFDIEETMRDWVTQLSSSRRRQEAILVRLNRRAEELIQDPRNWAAVEALAALLGVRGRLGGREATALIDRHLCGGEAG